MRLTRRGRLVFAGLGLVLLLALIAGASLAALRALGLIASQAPGKEVEVEIVRGASLDEVGRVLEQRGVIRSATGFRVAALRVEGSDRLQAGTYRLPQGLSAEEALRMMLEQGPVQKVLTVTFPEGYWLSEFARRAGESLGIAEEAFLRASRSGEIRSVYQPRRIETLEGLLFPATYTFPPQTGAGEVVSRLVEEFDRRAGELGIEQGAARLGLTPYEIVIVASMIEAESKLDEERPKVARVIYNRLELGWPLGIDATLVYALKERGRQLSGPDLELESPYNTRKFKGLPPTPIGAPSLSSLEAALHPARGDWLYYVLADCDGRHAFATNDQEFLADKQRYQELDCS